VDPDPLRIRCGQTSRPITAIHRDHRDCPAAGNCAGEQRLTSRKPFATRVSEFSFQLRCKTNEPSFQ
ncbi:MAG: hypothetical protein WBI50_09370, partial [Acetomicrobium sp.]